MLFFALLAVSAHPVALDERPNVLLVVADDLSERDVDRIETPTFDSLVERGLRFRRAYANPTCSPSRWSLHFGQYHEQDSGPVCNGFRADIAPSTSKPSLAKLFSGAGYRTALFGKWHLGAHPGVENGEPWEETPRLHGFETWRAGIPVNVASCGGHHYQRWTRVDDGRSTTSKDYLPDAITEAFLGWLAERDEEPDPWFAMICFQLPHAPFHIAPDVPPERWRQGMNTREMYESQTRYLDTKLGELLAPIDLDTTVVMFVADNGSPPLARTSRQHPKKMKGSTFENGIAVPMVWAGAGIPSGVETRELVHLADFLPTCAELVGAELEAGGIDGVSLVPLLQASSASNEPSTPGLGRDYVWCGLAPSKRTPEGDYAVVTARHKLRRSDNGYQLFDLKTDPGESTNLAQKARHAALVADLKEKLERHIDRP